MPYHALKERKRNPVQPSAARKFKKLVRTWLTENPGYDDRVWPRVKEVIEENRLSSRKRFDD